MLEEYITRIKELNPAVSVRQATLQDSANFVTFFNKHYKRKTSANYFEWQFFKSSLLSTIFLAFDSEELIGSYGIKIHPLNNGDLTAFVIDFLVDESHRKKGIAYLLEGAAQLFAKENNIAVFTALPNVFGNAALKSLGWKSIAKIDVLILHKGNYRMGDNPTVPSPKYISYQKDGEYRKWRFDQHPVYKYEKINGENDSFAVIKQFTDPSTGHIYGDIVDFYSAASDYGLLLQNVIQTLESWKIGTITTWALPHTHLHTHYIQSGFEITPQERYFCVKPLLDDNEYLGITNWELVQIDAEIF